MPQIYFWCGVIAAVVGILLLVMAVMTIMLIRRTTVLEKIIPDLQLQITNLNQYFNDQIQQKASDYARYVEDEIRSVKEVCKSYTDTRIDKLAVSKISTKG